MNRASSIVLCALALAACGGRADVADVLGTTVEIDTIAFEGNTRFDDDELIEYMIMGESSWLPLTEPHYFNPAFVPADTRRLEAVYQAFGYFDVTVEARSEVSEEDDEATVWFRIDEGEPTRIVSVDFDWQGDPDSIDDEAPAAAKATIEALAVTPVDAVIELAAVDRSRADMRVALLERGHDQATVVERVEVDRAARTAKVLYTLTPGRAVTVDRVEFEGLGYAPEYKVAREVKFAAGRKYTPSLMDRIESAVYGLDVFRTVVALPESSDDDRVAIKVRVDEAPPETIKLGFGLLIDPNRWEQRVTGLYTHRNLFGRLTRLDLKAVAGWAELPDPLTLTRHGPVAELAPTLSEKGLLEDQLVWKLTPSIEMGVEEGYRFWAAENRISVSRFFFSRLQTTLSHSIRHVDFFGFDAGCLPVDAIEGDEEMVDQACVSSAAVGFFDLGDVDPATLPDDLGFRDPYQVSGIQLDANLYLTDRIVDPRNGLILGASYDIVGGVFGGDFDFTRLTPSARLYWRPHSRLQLAGRLQLGQIHPYGDEPAVPIDMRYALGGATTVRGWGLERLSPRSDPACNDDDPSNGCGGIAIGGLTSVLANVEIRWRVGGAFLLATFLDAGDVRAGVAEYALDALYYSSGAGLRLDTPVGLVRLDVGIRLNDPARFGDEDRWALHLGLGEAF